MQDVRGADQREGKAVPGLRGKNKKKLSPLGKVLVAILCALCVVSLSSMISVSPSSPQNYANNELEKQTENTGTEYVLESEEDKPKELSREEYIAQCEDLSYSAISRDPDDYKGRKVVISGTVIEVQEGFLNSVTLRVQTPFGIWYVTYSRPEGESRILENDQITCYGECKGVQTYIAVLGNQVTIPSMRMEYYD
jgi:hypothetical protein|nr:MAG TPA: putative nucleic acid-binding lipoprotein.1, putative nucleic acid-binding lipoprotein [Caudoviricetes sp.]